MQQAGAMAPALDIAAPTTTTGTKRKHDVLPAPATGPTAVLLSALKRAEVRWFKGSLQVKT
jgi:hypothetical protein